jgi:hydroxyacyl-ACP dehydratase HTD2-like protein with hotdog domain
MSAPQLAADTAVPTITRTPEAVDLFMFSAAAWLLHRIHYDLPFTTEHDGHPGLLIHGPLQGTYMIQSVQWWLGSHARLKSITYRHSAPAYLGDELECGGTITEVSEDGFSTELWVRKADGTVTTSGTATFVWGGDSTMTDTTGSK